MKIIVDRLLRRDEGEKLEYLFYFQMGVTLFALLMELFSGKLGIAFFGHLIFLLFLYRYYYLALQNYYYTFWTLSAFLGFYHVCGVFQYTNSDFLFYLYLLAFVLLIIPCYVLSSPIYYPRVSWWEYDFRFRGDLIIETEIDDEKYPGRLTDLRRNAGCVQSFERISVGKTFKVFAKMNDNEMNYEVKVVSRRPTSLGRGFTYGVQFLLNGVEDVEHFRLFARYWQIHKNAKKRAKFSLKEEV